jgi:hypothetical protein
MLPAGTVGSVGHSLRRAGEIWVAINESARSNQDRYTERAEPSTAVGCRRDGCPSGVRREPPAPTACLGANHAALRADTSAKSHPRRQFTDKTQSMVSQFRFRSVFRPTLAEHQPEIVPGEKAPISARCGIALKPGARRRSSAWTLQIADRQHTTGIEMSHVRSFSNQRHATTSLEGCDIHRGAESPWASAYRNIADARYQALRRAWRRHG